MAENVEHPFAIIKPIAFTPSMLVSTTVPEADPSAWVAGAYTPGQIVSLATTQRCYECLLAHNGGSPDQNVLGPTPKWKESASYAMAWLPGQYVKKGARFRLASTHRVYECQIAHQGAAGSSAAVTMTIAAPSAIAWAAHMLVAGTEVTLSTTGSLPGGFVAGVTYYVVAPTANGFNLAATPGGAAIAGTGTQSGVHTATVASTSPELNATGATAKWLDLGATNAYAFLDEKWGTQTVAMNSLTVVVRPGQVVDSIALLNLLGSRAVITCTVAGEVIYTKTVPLQTDIGVYDWKTYFMAPIVAEDDIVVTDLLPYYQQSISITVTGPGVVAIGNMSLGTYIELGALQFSPKVGIVDYSTKDVDRFGNPTIVERAYSKRFGGTVEVANSFVDQLTAILAKIRATPVVWMGAGSLYSSLIVWGFFKDFEVDIAYAQVSYCTINIEGIT